MNCRSNAFEFTCLGKKINEIVSAIFHSVIFNRCFGKFNYNLGDAYSIGTLGFEEVACDFIDFTYIRVASLELVKIINQHIKIFVDELRYLALNDCRLNANSPSSTQQQVTIKNQNVPISSAFRRPSSLLNMEQPSSPPSHHAQMQQHQYRRFSSNQDFQLSPFYAAATGSISLEFFLKNKSRPFAFTDALIWEVWTLKINCLKDETNESLFNKTTIEDQLFDKILSIVSIINNSNNTYLPQMPSEAELESVFDVNYSDVQPYNFKISYKVGKDSNESSDKSGGILGDGQEKLKKFFEKLSL